MSRHRNGAGWYLQGLPHPVPGIGFYSIASSVGELEGAFLFPTSLTEGHVTAVSRRVLTVCGISPNRGSASVCAWLRALVIMGDGSNKQTHSYSLPSYDWTAGAALGEEQEDSSSVSIVGGLGIL